jgi:predicted lactoylglutathione lyase
LIELNRGHARLDLPDFEPASRNDVDALGAFLEANGMTVVDPPGDGRSYYALHFTDPDGMKLEAWCTSRRRSNGGRGRGKPTAFYGSLA